MMIFDLPTSVEFGGKEWEINSDYRDILTILAAFEDEELDDKEKVFVCLYNFYPDFENIPKEQIKDAYEKAFEFINRGQDESKKNNKRTMDWEQDAPIIFPAINSVAGYEVRSVDYLHWWTFLGFFMEIHEGTCATVFSLRQKKARGKKLEKYEQDFWNHNKDICVLRRKETAEDKAEKERLNALLGGKQ